MPTGEVLSMRIRILDRILVALSGVVLVGACAGIVARVFFGKNVAGYIRRVFSIDTASGRIIVGVIAALLLLLGVYCIMILFRHRRRKDKFILQKLESGELAISLKTLETMVQKCLDQHPEIRTDSIRLENQRDGLLVRIRGTVAGGVSIPLTADTLQKQVKQYVTACSGVEVKGIRIQIESSGVEAKDAPFAIEPPASMRLTTGNEAPADEEPVSEPFIPDEAVPSGEDKTKPETAPEPVTVPIGEESAAAAALAAAESLMSGIEPADDDRPIHQRLFSSQEEPCIMPLPPENLNLEEEKKKEEPEILEEPVSPDQSATASENPDTETDKQKGETET